MRYSFFRNLLQILITLVIIAICVVVFIGQSVGFVSLYQYALNPAAVINSHEYYRLVTSAFIHGDLNHLAVNMYSLLSLGTFTETTYGRRKYLLISLVSLLGASLAVTNFSDPSTYTVGYSGVLFGLMGAYAVHLYRDDHHLDSYELQTLARMLLPNLIISFMPGISMSGHFGGFIAGLLCSLLVYGKNQYR